MLYFIYDLLDDPLADIPFYVGMTDNPDERYQAHLQGDREHNQAKNDRIDQIIASGGVLQMKIRETVYDGKEAAMEREYARIQMLLDQGVQLTNIRLVRKDKRVKYYASNWTEQQCFTAKEVYSLEETMRILSLTRDEVRALAKTEPTEEGKYIRAAYISLYKTYVYIKADVDAMASYRTIRPHL